jgi:hypothetical protein
VRLTAAQYEAVRKHPDRFIIASAHMVDSADVISRHDEFQVIVKRGAEGSAAARLDPRQQSGAS